MEFDFASLEKEKAEVEAFLAKPDAYTDPEFALRSKRGAELAQIFELKAQI